MSSKAMMEKKDETPAPGRWRIMPEQAPSDVGEAGTLFIRLVGMAGLLIVMLGVMVLLVYTFGPRTTLAAWLGPSWGTFFAAVGLGLMLYHAVSDADNDMRRAYMVFGYLWLIVGALVSILQSEGQTGARFLPYGFVSFMMGLLFLAAFARHETDSKIRDRAAYVILALGLAASFLGFIGGSLYASFLFPRGVALILLGLIYWGAFVALRGMSSDQGFNAGIGMGVVGMVFFAMALVRSIAPPLAAYFKWSTALTPYLMPNGLVMMGSGLLFLIFSLMSCSDRQLVVLTRKEFIGYFQTPLAYLVIFGFALLAWYMFLIFVTNALWTISGAPRSQLEPITQYYLSWGLYPVSLIIVVPALTMRLFSEEKRSGTLEMLFTTPLNEGTVVVSKFLAALFFFMLIHLPWALELLALRVLGGQTFDYRPALGFFVALFFVGTNVIAMGVFFSSLSRNQLAAALLTFVALVLLVTLKAFQGYLTRDGFLYLFVDHVSFLEVLNKAIEGKMALRDLFYQVSAGVFWLFLTTKVLESRKWW